MADQDTSDVKFLETISKKLSIEVLIDILKQCANDDNVVYDGIVRQTSSPIRSDSYVSDIYRFTVKGFVIDESKEKCPIEVPVFVKALPQNLARRKTMRSTDLFQNEINFYTKVWPRLLQFQEEKDYVIFKDIPRCKSYVCDGENDFIILEDITSLNYGSIEKGRILNVEHCLSVMKLYANFHSVSFAFKNQHAKEYMVLESNLKENYFSEQLRNWHSKYIEKLKDVWSDALTHEVYGTVYQRKFDALMENDFYGQIQKLAENKGKYSVLCQGDARLTNFMFQYEESDEPKSVYMTDFQFARTGSLVLDLVYFLYVGVSHSIRGIHWEDLLQEYHTTFTRNVKHLGTDPGIFTFNNLWMEFLKYGKFSIGICLEMYPLALMEDEETVDLEVLEAEEEVDISKVRKVRKFTTKVEQLHLVDAVRDMVVRGFMEQPK